MSGASPVRAASALLASCLAVAAAGCSQGDPPLAEVRGTVTFNGLPAHAELVFEPQKPGPGKAGGGRPSSAYTEADGTYRLRFSESRPGAVIGTHRVTIRVLRPPSDDPQRSFDDATGPLKLLRLRRTVVPGTNEFDFAAVL